MFNPPRSVRNFFLPHSQKTSPWAGWWLNKPTRLKHMLVKMDSSSPILGVNIKKKDEIHQVN